MYDGAAFQLEKQLTMALGDVVDQLHDQHSLAHTGTAEQANLASLLVGRQEIDDLDSSRQHLLLCALLHKGWSLPMDGGVVLGICKFDGALRIALA